jgi:type II secretion system protein N
VLDTTLSISNCSVELPTPLANLDTLAFSRVTADIALDKDRLEIKNCNLMGRQVAGEFTGMISLRNPYEKSSLNLTGTLKPNQIMLAAMKDLLPEYAFAQISSGKKEFTIRIQGPVENPNVRFN